MVNFGTVKAGTILYIPFATYNSTGASVTMTGLAVGDIKIYKDGSTTERASTSGFTLLDTDGTDFDAVTGLQGFSIDLSDNTTAGFYADGSQYWVVVSTVTIDSQVVTLIAATFRIGVPEANIIQANGVAVTALSDLYHADIQFTRDQANTQDEWTVTWFKNGVRVTAGITSPTLEAVKRVDGTDLFAATSMSQIGTTGSYKLDRLTTNRITVGEAVIAVAVATIDSASRSFSRVIGRDSS